MDALTVYGIVGLSVLGLALNAIGVILIIRAIQVRGEIKNAMLEEGVTTPTGEGRPGSAPVERPPDAPPLLPAEPVTDARTARTRIDEIKGRTLHAHGPFQLLPQDDPRRQSFLNGLVLRNALNMAIMGYGVTNIALATGVGFTMRGISAVALGVPLLIAIED